MFKTDFLWVDVENRFLNEKLNIYSRHAPEAGKFFKKSTEDLIYESE